MAVKKKTSQTARARAIRKAERLGVVHSTIKHCWDDSQASGETSVEILFHEVSHSEGSYEVRVFLNNKRATINTERLTKNGYAGRFVVFGHGGCFGESGHCEFELAVNDPINPFRPHPVRPLTRLITVPTDLIRQNLEKGKMLETITLVPISASGKRRDQKPTNELFSCSEVVVRTYV